MAIVFDSDAGTITGLSVGGLPDGIVDAGTLASNAVTNAKITDGAVDAAALATNSVDSAELVDGAVDDSHMASISGRRNILINGDMRVAQYAANNTAINTYGPCDRWRTYGGAMGFTVSQQSSSDYESGYCLRFHRTASNSQTNNTGMGQGIETLNSRGLAGKTVTLSFKAKCGANFSSTSNILMSRINGGEGTNDNPFGMTNTNGGSQNNTLTTSVQTFSLSFAMPSDKTQVTAMFDYTPTGTAGANDWFEIGDVQLELGSTATDFEHRHYGEELALCQRYYQRYGGLAYVGIASGKQFNTTSISTFNFNYPTEMRSAPSISFSDLDVTDRASFDLAVSNTSGSIAGKTGVYLKVGHNAGGTAGGAVLLAADSGGSGYLAFEAEL